MDDDPDDATVEVQSASSVPHVSRYRIATGAVFEDLGDVAVIDVCGSPPSSPDAEVPDESVWTCRESLAAEVPDYDLPDTARLDINDTARSVTTARIELAELDTERSATLPTTCCRSPYSTDCDDLGFVDGDEETDHHQRSVTFMDQATDINPERQKYEHYHEHQRKKYQERQERIESMSTVQTRRQKFHRGFNFVRARYPSAEGSKGPKMPASLCPPTRYGKEARVAEGRERSRKKINWPQPPSYPSRQRFKNVASDCQIMRYVEKCDLAVQCTPHSHVRTYLSLPVTYEI